MTPLDLDNPVFDPDHPEKPETCRSKSCLMESASYRVNYSPVTNQALLKVIGLAPSSSPGPRFTDRFAQNLVFIGCSGNCWRYNQWKVSLIIMIYDF